MRPDRALWVALAALGLTFACVMLYQQGPGNLPWLPGCTFRKLTGLYCPGCGMTRAAYSSLHGDVAHAFRMNPVGMVLFPIAMTGLGFELLGWVRNKPLPFRFNVGPRLAWTIAYGMIAFWILRNIPVWPFTLLAPI